MSDTRFTRRLLALLACTFLTSSGASAASWERVDGISGGKPQRVLIHGKARLYIRMTDRDPVTVTVNGPARLKVISRVEPGSGPTVRYSIRITEGGRMIASRATESGPAPDARLASGSRKTLTKSRSFEIPVPDGEHRYVLSGAGVPTLYLRTLVAAPKRGGEKMLSIAPVDAVRSVTLSERERLIPYYSVFPGRPLRFRIVGPTRVEISCRLDFDETMRGEQRYALLVLRSGQRLREIRFRTTKAATAAYADLKDRIPSKVDRVVLPLGSGSHEITVELREPPSGSAEVHLRIPEPKQGSSP